MFDYYRVRGGFTLVEILVVVAIISIFSTITLVTLAQNRVERELRSESQQLAATLRESQNYALTGQTASIGAKNCWYGTEFTNPSRYKIVRQPKGVAPTCAAGPLTDALVTERTYDFTNGVTMTLTPAVALAGFNLPRGDAGYRLAGGPGLLTSLAGGSIRITLSKNGTDYYICMSATGRVDERMTDSTCP